MKIKTRELEGAMLDWAVAKIDQQCEGLEWMVPVEGMPAVGYGEIDGRKEPCAYLAYGCLLRRKMQMRRDDVMAYAPSTDWSQGGPLIEENAIELHTNTGEQHGEDERWYAVVPTSASGARGAMGPTPLVAAMRALVFAKLGEEIEVPAELQAVERRES